MKCTVKRVLSVILVAVIVFGSAPLKGFVGLDFPEFGDLFIKKAEAATYNGTCGSSLTWLFDDATGELSISGTGAMSDWSSGTSPWYSHREKIKSVIIGDDVTSIGNYAFQNCSALESVTIGSGVTTIGSYSFAYCSMIEEISIPDNVAVIGNFAFRNCISLVDLTLGKGVTTIGNHALRDCTALKSVTISGSALNISEYLFFNCTALNSVTISDSVQTISKNAFYNCSALADIYFMGNEGEWNAVTIYEGNDVLQSASVHIAKRVITWIVDGVETVDEYKPGDEIVIPKDPVKNKYTFTGWSAEVPSTMPDCDLVFTATWERIPITGTCGGNITWSYNEDTFELTISGTGDMPASITSIASLVDYRSEIRRIVIKDGVTSIGRNAFYNCDDLWSVEIPDSVKTINPYAFYYCSWLSHVYFTGSQNEWNSINIYEEGNNKLNNATVHIAVKEITWIVDGAETVDEYSFGDEIIIPETPVKDGYIFKGWSAEIPETMPDYDLEFTAILEKILVTGTCGENLTWSLNDETGELIISGTGDMYDWTSATSPWYSYRTMIKKVIIGDGVTSIGNYAFQNCNVFESITIGKDVTRIGDCAFYSCKLITSIVIPEGVTQIGAKAFYQCTGLKEVNIPYGVTVIGDSTFLNCTSLTSIVIPDSVKTIEKMAFISCKALTDVEIGGGVTSIGERAFFNCSVLSNVSYNGYKEGWEAITIGAYNDPLINATLQINLKHSVIWIIDGNEICHEYNSGETIVPPETPVKEGYTFAGWTPAVPLVMPKYDLSFTATWLNEIRGTCGDNLTWVLNNDTGELTISSSGSSVGKMTEWENISLVPWYNYRSKIKSITINGLIESLSSYAFKNCTSLENVKIGTYVTRIGYETFSNCISLESIEIPDSVTSLSNRAFADCTSLKSVILGERLTNIGYNAFCNCMSLESITVDENNFSYSSDENGVLFDNSKSVLILYPWGNERTSYEIPASVVTIEETVFDNCFALKEITVNESNSAYSADEYGVLFNKDKTVLVRYPAGNERTSYAVPSEVITVKDGAFKDCISLTSLSLPEELTDVRYEAFSGTGLDNDPNNWDNGIFYVGNHLVYADTYGLNSCSVREGTKAICDYAFEGCSNLVSVTVPDSVSVIGEYAFKNCGSLQSVILPEGLTNISPYAFLYTNLYYNSTVWDDGFFYVGDHLVYVDYDCVDSEILANYTVKEGTKTICDYVFAGCSRISSIAFPDGLTTVGNYAFYNCTRLETVANTESLTAVGDYAFCDCSSLKSITTDNLIFIGENAFAGCSLLKSFTVSENSDLYSTDEYGVLFNKDKTVLIQYPLGSERTSYEIPDSVTEICDDAFRGSCYLESITVSENNGSFLSDEHGVLYNKDKTRLVFYPEGKEGNRYEIPASVRYVDVRSIQANGYLSDLSVNGDNEYFVSEDGVLFSKDKSVLVCYPSNKLEKLYLIPETVTTISSYAFVIKNNEMSVSIPKSVTVLEKYAIDTYYSFNNIYFGGSEEEWKALVEQNQQEIYSYRIFYNEQIIRDNCGLIYYINEDLSASVLLADETVKGDFVIPSTLGGCPVYRIEAGAFAFSQVTSVVIPEGITAIEESTFQDCELLEGVTIPDTVKCISYRAFYYCSNLKSVSLPYGITSIEDYTFYSCTSLESITIPDTVEYISYRAFSDCFNLKCIDLPEGLIAIDEYAFACCLALNTVHIPASVIEIHPTAFFKCAGITEFTVDEKNTRIYADEYGVIYDSEENIIIQYPLNSPITEFTIPDTVTGFYSESFFGVQNLKTLRIPASVTYVEDDCFYGKNIERYIVDENCSCLSSDEQGALYNKDKTVLYSCPPSIEDKNFVIPETVEDISHHAFYGSKDLILTIPDSVTYAALYYPDILNYISAKEFIVSETHPDLATHKGVLYTKDMKTLIKYPVDKETDIYMAPDSVEDIYFLAFILDYEEDILAVVIDGLDFISCCENLTLHIPKPISVYGIKRVCVSDADANELDAVNNELVETRNAFIDMREYFKAEFVVNEDNYIKNMLESLEALINCTNNIIVCGGDHSDVHSHNWVETVVEETCTTDGSITNFCTICEETNVTVIPASHKPGEWITVTEPTVSIEGKKARYCTVCGEETEFEIIPVIIIPVTGIIISETQAEIQNKGALQLYAEIVPEDASNKNVIWSSSDENVATVDENGVVTGVSSGEATVTATTELGGFTAECVVKVIFTKFTITLNIDGVQSVITATEGTKISIDTPVKEGHTFVKWIPEVPETMPSENLEFTAVFEPDSYTVEWNVDGLVMSEKYKFGEIIDKDKTFSKKGYRFIGWTPEIPDTMPAHDLVFTAIFEADSYVVTFSANFGAFPDGDTVKTFSVGYNTAIAVPQDPIRSGYKFGGWAYNGKNIGTDVGVMDNVDGKTFEAVWISDNATTYKIEFYTMNTVGEYEVSSTILNGTAFEEVSVTPAVSEGFELNAEKSVLNGVVSAQNPLVLKVYMDRKQYSFITVVNGIEKSVPYYYGSIIAEPVPPSKPGYIFVGWDAEIPATMPANDITVTAEFKEAPHDPTSPRIEIVTPDSRTLYYGESITLNAYVYNLPEGASIKWEVSGDGVSIKPLLNGKSCIVTSTSDGNVVIKAYVVDSKGNTISGADGKPVYDSEYLYSEVTFWQMILHFIRQLFGSLKQG